MFKPVGMNKVNLFIIEKDTKRVTELLYDLKLIEFFEIRKENFSKFEHEDINELSAKLLKLRSTITLLKQHFTRELEEISQNSIEEAQKLKDEESKIKKEIISIKDEIKRNKILKELNISEKELKDKKITIGFIPKNKQHFLKNFDKEEIKYRKITFDERTYFIAKTNNINFEFKEFYLPKQSPQNLRENLREKSNKLDEIKISLTTLANNNLLHLQKEELNLSKQISTIEVRSNFAKTQNISVLSGFIPKSKTKTLKLELEKELVDKFEIEVNEAKKDAPIELNNPSSPKKFESLLQMYSLPKYSEIDPTILIFLIFPLFYGFILGDVGYGILSFLAFTIAKRKLSNLKDFISTLQISSISSIIFGIIYGEYFGFEPYHPLLVRAKSPELLLIFAIIFGILHINLGIIIGFLNQIKDIKHAITDKLSWIILEFGAGFLAYGIHKQISTITYTGTLLLIISLILIYLGHGFIGIIEIPSFFTNILSYARLMAVGLSSVVIALLINEYSASLFSSGIIGIIGGICLFTIGHIFNIVLGNFEGFLHTLRLHYVEFFTKFYTGGGQEFKPFGKKAHEEHE